MTPTDVRFDCFNGRSDHNLWEPSSHWLSHMSNPEHVIDCLQKSGLPEHLSDLTKSFVLLLHTLFSSVVPVALLDSIKTHKIITAHIFI